MKKKTKYGLTRIRVESYNEAVNGAAVKACRESAGLTQSQAATALGWTVQRWSDFEKARHPNPRIGTLLAVCSVLKCKVEQLLVK